MNDFQAASDRFLSWFKSVGGEFREDLLAIKDLRAQNAGRGIIATKDIAQETTLFTIPRDAIINVETSELVSKLPNIFDGPEHNEDNDDEEDAGPLDSWASLILVMLYEYLQGDASRWKLYFDVLPQVFDTPIFWTTEELKELQGTCLTSEKIGKQESDEMLRSRILPLVQEHASVFYPQNAARLDDEELLTLAHRMGSTIMAYAFDLEDDNEQSDNEEEGWIEDREGKSMLGMVPMADMLNANAEFNAHVNHGDNLEVTALRSSLPVGAEVLNYYGPLPSSELLRRYGYVTSEHGRYDVVELPWSLVTASMAAELDIEEQILRDMEQDFDEEDLEDYFILERDSGEPDDEGRLTYDAKLREMPPELLEQLKAFFKIVAKNEPNRIGDKRKRESLRDAVLVAALHAKLEQYPTSKMEDEALLKRDDISKRHRMAIKVRLGEKMLLEEAITLLHTAEDASAERGTKKVKSAE